MADPPWPHNEGFAATLASGKDMHIVHGVPTKRELPYSTMSLEALEALPVARLAERSGCRLFLWTTNRFLPHAFSILHVWGFEYRQTLVWNKLVASPFITSVARNSAEFLLVASIGSPERTGAFPGAVITQGRPKRHASKPELFIDYIEQVSPGPYVELFARRHRLGWDVWGDQSANTAELAIKSVSQT